MPVDDRLDSEETCACDEARRTPHERAIEAARHAMLSGHAYRAWDFGLPRMPTEGLAWDEPNQRWIERE